MTRGLTISPFLQRLLPALLLYYSREHYCAMSPAEQYIWLAALQYGAAEFPLLSTGVPPNYPWSFSDTSLKLVLNRPTCL